MKNDPPELGKGLFGYRKSAVNQIIADRDIMLRQAEGRVRAAESRVAELEAELAAMRERNARMDEQLERLRRQVDAMAQPAGRAEPPSQWPAAVPAEEAPTVSPPEPPTGAGREPAPADLPQYYVEAAPAGGQPPDREEGAAAWEPAERAFGAGEPTFGGFGGEGVEGFEPQEAEPPRPEEPSWGPVEARAEEAREAEGGEPFGPAFEASVGEGSLTWTLGETPEAPPEGSTEPEAPGGEAPVDRYGYTTGGAIYGVREEAAQSEPAEPAPAWLPSPGPSEPSSGWAEPAPVEPGGPAGWAPAQAAAPEPPRTAEGPGAAEGPPRDDLTSRFLNEELAAILRSAEESAARIVERARTATQHQIAESNRLWREVQTEVARFAAWKQEVEPVIQTVQSKVASVRAQIEEVPERIREALAPMADSISAIDSDLAELAAAATPPLLLAPSDLQGGGEDTDLPAEESPEAPGLSRHAG